MIHYQLRCHAGHGFEGWFRGSEAFEQQAARGLLSCPHCGSQEVERALMAPSVQSSRKRSAVPAESQAAERQAAGQEEAGREAARQQAAMLPDKLRAALQRLRAEVEQHCDNVGDRFAEVVRERHRAGPDPSQPVRGIYGNATEPEREALADEGIEVVRIPWLPRADS